MRLKTLVLCSTSTVMLTIAAPALAQDQTGAPDAAAPAGEPDIVVTGLRESLQSAQQLKRNSEQVVDAIVAEDIGKLPDLAVSETAARIPGIQVTRRGGEADTVLVRGLPDFATTYNGREIFTAETRVVALQDFPSANIAALEVYKTTTANLVEAGLAGLVNVRSRRPFDFDGFKLAGSAWALHTKQAGEWTPNGNVLISDRWDTGAGDFGALLNFSYTELQYLDSEPSNTDFIAPGPNGSRFPDIQRLFYRSGNRARPSINGALQWRPSPGLEFYAEGLWQGFRNKIDDRLLEVPLYAGQYSNLVFREGTDLLSSGTVANSPGAIFSFQGGTYNKTDTFQFAVGGSYEAGPLRITADIARTDSKFTGSTESVDRTITGGRTVDFDLETPQFAIRDFDAADPANYRFDGFYEEAQESKGDDWQARLDAEYETDWSFLPRIQLGARYTDHDAHREFGNRFAGFRGRDIPIGDVPLDFQLVRAGFRGTDVQPTRTFLAPTYTSIRAHREEMRRFVLSLAPFGGFGTFTENDPTPNPRDTYDATEETIAGYAQLNYEIGDTIDGVVGLRAVHTKTGVTGTSIVEGVETPVSVSNSYTDWLPNASMRIHLTPELQLRFSATQTRTRPTFAQLNPSASLGPPPSNCNPNASDPFACARTGGGGNPFLKPFTSNNYDASLEYYFSRVGFASLALFRRDLKGFIENQQVRYVDPALGPLIINGPVNTRSGQIDGFEAQFSTFFDFDFLPDWARGFGAQANVTYLDTEVDRENGMGGFLRGRIFGVAKWTYNLVGMYERNGLSARLSYNKRGSSLETVQFRGNQSDPNDFGNDIYMEFAHPAGRLDLSTSYAFTDNLTVFFDWTNILEDPFKQTLSSARQGAARSEYIRFLRFEETTYSLGVRFNF